jgi:TPP-dependent pyruvate/acetoin dehydrogenase alpha subunit
MLGRAGRDSVYNRNIQGLAKDNRGPMGNRRNGKATPDGTTTAEGKFSLISNEKLIALYRNLLRSRQIGRNGRTSNGKRGAATDHHAAVVGTAIDLGPGDVICSLGRQLLSGLSRENAIELLLFGSGQNGGSGLSGGKNGMAANGAPGSPFAHTAIGTALVNKTSRNGKVAVIYCAGTNSDGLREVLHIASVHALPMVFVQQWSVEPGRRSANTNRTNRSKNSEVETPWFPSITVDSNDVVAVYRVANEAISRARLGRGPTLIECRPYFLAGKRLSGNRPRSLDAVQNMEHYLRTKGLFDPRQKSAAMAEPKER